MADDINKEVLDDAEFITLEFDDGTSVEAEIMGIFDVDGKEYIALIPDDDTDDVYLYGYRENEEDFDLLDIEDELFDKVAAEFESLMDEPL